MLQVNNIGNNFATDKTLFIVSHLSHLHPGEESMF